MPERTKIVVFSKDRPMQCHATIESLLNYCSDIPYNYVDIVVLYDVSNEKFLEGYDRLINEFSVSNQFIKQIRFIKRIQFLKQTNFKQNLLDLLDPYKYVFFIVDDNQFVFYFSVYDGIKFLEENCDAISFSYRMGRNINYCYPVDKPQKLRSDFYYLDDNLLIVNWYEQALDWKYPMDLSSSLYRFDDINEILNKLDYNNPNELEYYLECCKYTFNKPFFGCYAQSVAFCNPINKVNVNNANRSGTNISYSTQELLDKYLKGYKINIEKFENFIPNSPHQEVGIEFIK
jgi:hypothetical protein